MLSQAHTCDRWGCLPKPGGERDQPYGILERMEIVLTVFQAYLGRQATSDLAAWANTNPGLYKTWQWVEELRRGR